MYHMSPLGQALAGGCSDARAGMAMRQAIKQAGVLDGCADCYTMGSTRAMDGEMQGCVLALSLMWFLLADSYLTYLRLMGASCMRRPGGLSKAGERSGWVWSDRLGSDRISERIMHAGFFMLVICRG